MSRQAIRGIGQVIKANTTEKSIDELRAEGKHRVRVVSSERVMAIIQAIVDDTINSEVGEITKRDRDRIVSDTQERFSRVFKMQQDLEQKVDDLRGSLRDAELERDRLRSDKSLLESQLATARRPDGDEGVVARFGRDLSRVRDAVERTPRDVGVLDESAISRVVEKLAARDAQSARRTAAEFDDLRTRLDAVSRDAAASRDATTEKTLQRVKEQQAQMETHLAARLDHEFRSVAVCLAGIRGEVGAASAGDDDSARLRVVLDSIENRVHVMERASAELAERVAKSVTESIAARESAKAEDENSAATRATDALSRMQRSSDEGRENLLVEMRALRETVDESRTFVASVQAEQLRDLEQRVAGGASESADVLTRTVELLAERTAALDDSLQVLRRELAGVVEHAVAETSAAPTVAALADIRLEFVRSAARATEAHSALAERVDGSFTELRGELLSLSARGIESAERQHDAVRALRAEIAQSAAVQSDSLGATFDDAIELALDKITRTMERATARPIESDGEATEALVARMFDAPDGELTSNLDQLEVEERRANGGFAKSVDRLKQMNGAATNGNGKS